MTVEKAPDTMPKVKSRIEALGRIRRDHLKKAQEMQEKIEQLQHTLALMMRDYAKEMGIQMSVRAPRAERKPARCSICAAQGLSGEGHTASRHHLLVVQGKLTEPTT